MDLIHFFGLVWAGMSSRTLNVEGNQPATVVFDMESESEFDVKQKTFGRGGRQSSHHTAFLVGGSVSESVMLDNYNVKDILDQILRTVESDTKKHEAKIAKIRKSDDQKYFLCEWTSDVSKDAFAKVYEWGETQYTTLNQWVHTNLQPKILVRSPSGDETTDMDNSHFEIIKIKPFEWDTRPKQYRMVAFKVTGSKRNNVIEHNGLKEVLEHALVDQSNPDHPQIEIIKTAQDNTDENVLRVGFVTKMTEAEIADKIATFNYGPLNDWLRQTFPKEILDDGTKIDSTVLELKFLKLRPDFDRDWYMEYNLANPGRRGHNTHLTAFGVGGTLSEELMLDKGKVKELVEHIVTTEGHRIENNHVTIEKLEKASNGKYFLCEWTSDLSQEAFDQVFAWTAEQYAELNKWARNNLFRHVHDVIVATFPMTSDMLASEFEIAKMMPFQWDTRDEGLQMVSIKVTGSKRTDVVSENGLKILLQRALTDESDPNHPSIEIWKTAPSDTESNVQRVAFITKIPTADILANLKAFDYQPLNEWARTTFTANTVHELKIFAIKDDFELSWYEQWLRS